MPGWLCLQKKTMAIQFDAPSVLYQQYHSKDFEDFAVHRFYFLTEAWY
jgi:hypothetical protein